MSELEYMLFSSLWHLKMDLSDPTLLRYERSPVHLVLDLKSLHLILSKTQKELQVVVWSCPEENLARSHTLTFFKKYLCSEKYKFRNNWFWICVFHYMNIFWKKLEYGIKLNFPKDSIRLPLVIFFCIFETNYINKIKSFSNSKWTGLESVANNLPYFFKSCRYPPYYLRNYRWRGLNMFLSHF